MLQQQITLTVMVLVLLTIIDLLSRAANHTDEPRSPAFANQRPNIYVFETDENGNQQNLILPCPIDAPSPTLNYTWFKGNQELPGSMVNGKGSLIVPNITEGEYASREGVDYYCIASDNIGFNVGVRSRNITVYYAYFNGFERMAVSGESIVEVPIPVALNSDVALECDVLDANPPPQIKWCNDQGEIQEVFQSNRVRFLDGGHYLYLRSINSTQLEQQYYCNVTNVNLSLEISAPTRYVLIDNTTQGELMDYKQIGELKAFVGNTSFEFAYVGGVFGFSNYNETINILTVNDFEVAVLGSIGMIPQTILNISGMVPLKTTVFYNGMVAMRSGTLTIYQVPRITNTFRDERGHFGKESLTYTCQFEGFPLPNIIFFFNGAVISPDSGVTINNNTLTIPIPEPNHSGIYQCIVSNDFGDDQQAWLLEIRQPILPTVQPLNLTKLGALDDRNLGALIVRNNGSIVNFSLDVMGDPCPGVVWIFNDIMLGSSNNTFMYNNPCRAVDDRNSIWTYTLNVLLTLKTSGKYSANFTNIAGTAFLLRAYFTVPVPISGIGLSLNETCLKEGSSVSIRCNIRGFPRPRIEFRKNNIKITPEAWMFENILLEFYDQIVIKNITMKDEGLYSCMVVDGQPLDSQNFNFCSLPRITGVDITPNPLIGESFFIECSIDGIPQPSMVWMKDGAPLEENQNDDSIRIVTTPAGNSSRVEFFSASIDDNGEYECIVSNVAGSVRHSFSIELMQAHTLQDAGSDNIVPSVSTPLSRGLIVGVTVAATVLISVALLVVLVLVCIIYQLCVSDKSSKPQIVSTYSANVVYTGTLQHLRDSEQLEAIDPLYDTIPFSHPAVQTTEKVQIYKRAHIHEKVYEDIQLIEQPPKNMTISPIPGNNILKNIPVDKVHTDKGIIEISHDEDNEKNGQKSPKIKRQGEHETTLDSGPLKCTKFKHPHSEAKVGMIKKDIKAKIRPRDDVGNDAEVGGSGNDDHEPAHTYASISAEHKAKKRRDKQGGQPKATIPPYETVPDFTEPAQAQSKDEQDHSLVQIYEKAQIYQRVQTYERINHNVTQLVEQLLSRSTCEKSSGTEDEEASSNIL